MDVDETIKERGKKYGSSFLDQSKIAQQLKEVLRRSPNWHRMRVDQRESLEMIATKISRICYGDPDDIDSWHDIQGYARLIEVEIAATQERLKS